MDEDTSTKAEGRSVLETVLDQQSERWKLDDRAPVEEFLARWPALRDDPEAVIDLVYQEVLLRRQLGESPLAEEYIARFPTCSEAIIRQFAVDEAMRTADDDKTVPPQVLAPVPIDGASGRPLLAVEVPLPAIDGYELLGVLGRGGMGVVYKARDLRLGRIIAIKTIAEFQHATPEQLGRFLAEAEVVARLQHPHIIQIHAIGEHQGRPFFSLEYAGGGSLARRLADGPMAADAAAELVETLARAVHAAHRGGIVHRDLKPSNVLLTHDDVPKVADFGLAKLLGSDSVRTLSGEALGTPSYMAPEQAEGRSKLVGPAADVYALGAVLYHTLAGRPPFVGDSAIETLKLVVSTDVIPPRRLRPGVPRDLETICLKCLEKEPRKRYATALTLADDLERFRERRPIAARPVGVVGRLWRQSRRNPMLSFSLAALALTFALGTPSLLWLWLGARAERDHAERSRDRALGAVRLLLETGGAAMRIEEVRPYRHALISAGLKESLALVRELEADPRAEHQRVEAYAALAGIQYEEGDRVAALESMRKAIALAENVVAHDPASIRFRYSLAVCLLRFAHMWPKADEYFAAARRSIEISQGLRDLHPRADQRDWISVIAMNHFNTGDRHFVAGRKSEALVSFLKASEAFKSLLELGDRRPETLSIAARTHAYLCRVYSNLGRVDEAVAEGRRASGIYRNLVADHPDDTDYGFDLSRADSEIGVMANFYERWDEAIDSFAGARGTLKGMIAKQGRPVSVMARLQEELALADHNLREAYGSDRARYRAERRALTRDGYEICDKLSLVEHLSWDMRIAFAHCCFSMADDQDEDGRRPDLDLYRKAEQLLAELVAGSPEHDENRSYLVYVERRLAEEHAARGQLADASYSQNRSVTTAQRRPAVYHMVAREYARRLVAIDRSPPKLDARITTARRQRLVDGTLEMLRGAVDAGFKDAKRLRNEPAFAPIRSLPEGQAIMADVEFPAQPFASP
ncbi:MAG: protein kinase domain-containing protein [Isosphaeraceae bacterium]